MGGLGGVGVAGGVGKGGGCAESTCAKLDEECAEECEPCAKLDEECAEFCEPGDGGGRGCRCAAPEAMLGSGAGGAAFAGCLGTAGDGDGAKSTSAKLAEECADECEPGDGGVGRWRGGAASGAAFPERSAFRRAFCSALSASATLCTKTYCSPRKQNGNLEKYAGQRTMERIPFALVSLRNGRDCPLACVYTSFSLFARSDFSLFARSKSA